MSKQAYEEGVVLVTCPGCQNKHVVADRLGWFGEKGSIEDIMREKGQAVLKWNKSGDLCLTPEDVAALRGGSGSSTKDNEQEETITK